MSVFYGVLLALYFSDGELDLTFSGDGLVTMALGVSEQANFILIQPDHQIVVGGFYNNGSNTDFLLLRYDEMGTLDPNFGNMGIVITEIGMGQDLAVSGLLQPDGKIVVAGSSFNGTTDDIALARYLPNGDLDPDFSMDGKVTTDLGASDYGRGVALQSDGKIVVVGHTNLSGNYDMLVARYLPNGLLDNSFDADGWVTTAVGLNNYGYAISLLPDGKILAAGKDETHAVLARYQTNGQLDNGFGTSGVATLTTGQTLEAVAMAVQTDGRIVLAGNAVFVAPIEIAAMRFLANGTPDPSFDGDGIASIAIDQSDQAKAVALQADGKILIAGATWDGSFTDMALVRFNTDGSPDSSFGNSGVVRQDFSSTQDAACAVAVQPDGKIIIGGYVYLAGNADVGLARYCAIHALASPFGAAQGLSPLTLTADVLCGDKNTQYQWENLTAGFVYPANTNPISVDPILSETSWFQVTVSDPVSMAQNATQVPILVHQAGILDWNMDGCNTLQDLWDAAQFWNQTYANDPNGDGKIDVRDFQYINTDDPSCP